MPSAESSPLPGDSVATLDPFEDIDESEQRAMDEELAERAADITARKSDGGKVRMDLVAWDAVRELAKVMTFGASKYDDRNYYGLRWSRLYAAAQRHMTAWWLGEDLDDETRLNHLAHAMAGCMMLLEMQMRGLGEDDRP